MVNKDQQIKEEVKDDKKKSKNKKKVTFDSGIDEDTLTEQFNNMKFSEEPVIFEDSHKKKKEKDSQTKAFLGTKKDLKPDEELDFDNRAYDMFHRTTPEWYYICL